MSYLQEWSKEVEAGLRKSSDILEVKKLQGQDEVLRRLLELKEELRSYGDKLLKGEVRKVENPDAKVLGKG